MQVDARQWPIREERLLTVHTYLSLLKPLNVTAVGIDLECGDAAFKLHFKVWKLNVVRIECDDAAY